MIMDMKYLMSGPGNQISVKELVNIISTILGRKIIIETEKNRLRKVERMHLVPDVSKMTSNWLET